MSGSTIPPSDRLQSLAEAIEWIVKQATDENGASEELRDKLKAAERQVALDLSAMDLARPA